MTAPSNRQRLLHRRMRARGLYTESLSWQTIDGCVCNELMVTEPGNTKLYFQMNHASIWETMTAAFVLDAMPENAAFQSALLNDMVAAISFYGRSNLLRFVGNLNSNRYVHEVLQPEVIFFL
ncbi:transposable element Tcb2 transposase [Trichonephila clavipes]|nr:transposable element Tcb2 transposase [Trichonephila clavipes]